MNHQSIKNIMFHANDSMKHDLYWSKLAHAWAIENINGLCDQSNGSKNDGFYYDLCEAISDMEVITSTESFDWTMTDNPYS